MAKINYNEYFGNNKDMYYEPIVMMNLLEKISGSEFTKTMDFLRTKKIEVTNSQIQNYLNERFENDDHELMVRIEDRKNKNSNISSSRLTKEEINDAGNRFIDNLAARKYTHNPDDLEYYKEYAEACSFKAKTILYIIGNICKKTAYKIEDSLNDLDIQLDENGNILKSDIIRLVKPAVYNINEFEKTIEKANNLDTYLEHEHSEEALIDGRIYARDLAIQINSLDNDLYEGNVPLTEKQKDEILEKQNKTMAKIMNMIED